MKIALVTYCKITNVEQYLPSNCTEILTNNLIIASLTASVPITYVPDLDEVIKNSDYVTALCSRKIKKTRRLFQGVSDTISLLNFIILIKNFAEG